MSRSTMLSPGPGGSELEDHRIQPRIGPHRRRIPQEPPFLSRHFLSSCIRSCSQKGSAQKPQQEPALCLCRMLTSPVGEKRTSRRERQKRGEAINLEQMLPWRGAEENILRNSGTWGGWRNQRGLCNQFPGTKNRCGGNK